MQPQDYIAAQPEQERIIRAKTPMKQLLGRLSIRQKIGFGYALVIGVAVVGTTVGQLVGKYYEKQAQQQNDRANSEEYLLKKLQISILQARSHQQQFISLIEYPALFEREHTSFLGHIKNSQKLFSELKSNVTNHFNTLEADVSDLEQFLDTYDYTIDAYSQNLETVLKPINPSYSRPKNIPAAQRALLVFTKSQVAQKLDNLSDSLELLAETARREQNETELDVKQAELLHLQIINISFLLSIALAVFLAFYTSRAIAHPIEAITEVAKIATKEGKFDLQVPVTTNDEVGVLATSFNNLIQRVADYTQQLEVARQTLEKRVEERTNELWHNNEQLESTQKLLQQLNVDLFQALEKEKDFRESKSHFVSMTSHELRNPLTTILSCAELLEYYSQKLTQESKNKQLSRIKSAVDRMIHLLDEVLLFSTAEAGKLKFNPTPLDLIAFCRTLVEEVQLSAGNQYAIAFTSQGEFLNPCMDKKLLQHILTNLLSNAVKYSPKGGVICFELARENGEAIFRIQDEGIGIPDTEQLQLFNTFFRAKNVGSISGTGLGLAIVKNCVDVHKGKIAVQSEVGVGTTFIVTLPLDLLHE